MKVSKKNFTPPPQVESSVVRLEPRTDRPNISWDEWDGMLRVCFMRKNKTMNATWTASKVRAMVEQNWVTLAAMNADVISESDWRVLRGEDDGVDDQMDDVADDDDDMGDADGDDDMDVDGTREKIKNIKVNGNKGGSVSLGGTQVPRAIVSKLILTKIRRVLSSTELSGQRAAKCDETDFLKLLSAFNDEGLHFA